MIRAVLAIQPDTGPASTYEISGEHTLVGRNLNAEVLLLDKGVSRDHAMIVWDDDHYEIEDLQTTNGTRLNGKKVRSATLNDGDIIQVGQTRLVFSLDSSS